ncbi:MAG: hypothetical protein ACTSYQ_02195 [Candidatus Odinarchaeia archaeon]
MKETIKEVLDILNIIESDPELKWKLLSKLKLEAVLKLGQFLV